MDSSSLLTRCAAVTGFITLLGTLLFLLYRKFRFRQDNKTMDSSSLSPLSPPSSLPRNWVHHVFPSFHGEDVRRNFLSHILKEFRSKGIDPFIDNEIVRGEFIGPELKEAIKGSKIAIVLLSKRYASSSWCLDELVEIMKCKKELGQTVLAIFYEVDPGDIKKQEGDFGKVFRKTCVGKTNEVIGKWRQALADVATVAGYHSKNWDNEAKMIEDIATDVSNVLFNSTPSRDFDCLVGMEAHMKKIERVLRTDLDEARMIGIWGPGGIGKSTIARFLFNRHYKDFQLSVFMENIRATYPIPVCSDDYCAKLHLQQKFMSQIINQKDVKIPHLGVAQDRLKDKKVLVVLDDVDQLVQLQAMAKETQWFGRGSRIIITTRDLNLLKAHGINHYYEVGFPPSDEALEIFCVYAFGQKSPKDGFKKVAWEVTRLSGKLPLGLRVMGSYFRGMSKLEWTMALPNLRNSLNGEIESILKFSYDALCDKDQSLFLHLACFFESEIVWKVEGFLMEAFPDIKQRLKVLVQKSLISIHNGLLNMHNLLIQLGREIARKKYATNGKPSIRKPGKRQFLVDARDICEVLSDDTAGSSSIIAIHLKLSKTDDEFYTSKRAFERMSNLQFLRIDGCRDRLHFTQSLNSMSQKLRLLDWTYSQLTCLPSNFNPKFLVDLSMRGSKLEKLWDGIRPLKNLQIMDLRNSENLKKVPDLSTATKLQTLLLNNCSSLVKLPSSIGNAVNLETLYLSGCLSLVKLPSSIGNATQLTSLEVDGCSSLVELPSSIGNLRKLRSLKMGGCSNLKVLPNNINMKSLGHLDLSNCSLIKTFPEISKNIRHLKLNGTAVEEVPLAIRSSWSCLEELRMSYSENLKELPHALDSITVLHFTDAEIQEVPPCIQGMSRLRKLVLKGCRKLISLPQLSDSLSKLDVENCESLERFDCSFCNPDIRLTFQNCFKLNQEARDRIIQTRRVAALPGGEVPACFTYQASGSSLTVKLNQKPVRTSTKFKACILLAKKRKYKFDDREKWSVSCSITSKQNGLTAYSGSSDEQKINPISEHLYTFEVEAEEVTSTELVFEFKLQTQFSIRTREIKECGIFELLELHGDDHYESFEGGDESSESSDEDFEPSGEDYESPDIGI